MATLPVKICCIQDRAELDLAIAGGADIVGLVSRMPSGWGPIPDDDIAGLVRATPPGVTSCLLSSRADADALIEQQRHVRANAIQIVDAFPLDGYERVREACPGVTLLQAVHVGDDSAIAAAERVAPFVDGIILDTGSPHGATKVLGGTGQTHDWSISARIVKAVDTPVFLAGGLKPHNVAEAIRTVRPWGIDLCTGVRSGDNMALDPAKLRAFMQAVADA